MTVFYMQVKGEDWEGDLGDGTDAETVKDEYIKILHEKFGEGPGGSIMVDNEDIALVVRKKGLPNITLVDLPGLPKVRIAADERSMHYHIDYHGLGLA